jgi:hypothetical protein
MFSFCSASCVILTERRNRDTHAGRKKPTAASPSLDISGSTALRRCRHSFHILLSPFSFHLSRVAAIAAAIPCAAVANIAARSPFPFRLFFQRLQCAWLFGSRGFQPLATQRISLALFPPHSSPAPAGKHTFPAAFPPFPARVASTASAAGTGNTVFPPTGFRATQTWRDEQPRLNRVSNF